MSKKKKKTEAGAGAEAGGNGISIAAHPRARAGIRRARTRAALIAFAVVLVLNLAGDQDPFDATWRALLAGIVVNVIAWRCAIVVWRHIILAQMRQAEERRIGRHREEQERLAARAGEQTELRST